MLRVQQDKQFLVIQKEGSSRRQAIVDGSCFTIDNRINHANILAMKKNYYEFKYPAWYPYSKPNGERGIMYTIPVKELVKIYTDTTGQKPKTFFDCGAANGHLLLEAENLGISATGVEKDKYSITTQAQKKLVKQDKLQIKSIEDCTPIKADLIYCNGVLTYMNDTKLALTLSKFNDANIIIISHDTVDDAFDAKEKNMFLPNLKEQMLRPIIWWVAYFQASGFNTVYDFAHQCFVMTPAKSKQKYRLAESAVRKQNRGLRIYPKIDLKKRSNTKNGLKKRRQIEMLQNNKNSKIR